jgi:lipopolysaccharide export system permease protein
VEQRAVNTVRRLIYAETVRAIAFVSLGFLALFFFFDFVKM